ncbi:PHD finger protein 10 [Dufourea novaeangliae]|uniref:PHD finger protein 10 n=1 Tax=Dufourea novaeangliae TaxID=178035 RepID=A0A154P2H0_DUFNO|nr:PHD finger protein 10 [Dufourea novaeangliae]
MSESPKMGLFGSKDKTKEGKKENKDDSPDRYAPYCIDSDSETYDTEALSIMDINDIIGVQAEPVSDSTLESEIAALSQIITESKTDGSQNMPESNVEENAQIRITDTKQDLETMSDELETLVGIEGVTSVGDMKHASEDYCNSNEIILMQDMELKSQQGNNNTKDNSEGSVLMDSAVVVDIKNTKNVDVSIRMDAKINQSTGECASKTMTDEGNVNLSSANQQEDSTVVINVLNSNITTVGNENSICGSLQLIGEAYSSEDSQEMRINDVESIVTESSVIFNEKIIIADEQKKEIDDCCELQDTINDITEISDTLRSSETSTNKNISLETIENEANNMKLDASNCSIQHHHVEEMYNTLQEIEISNECNVDNHGNVSSDCKTEQIMSDSVEIDKTNEQMSHEKETNNTQVKEGIVTVEYLKMEVEENIQPENDLSVSQEKKSEADLMKEPSEEIVEPKKCVESINVQEDENESKKCILEEKGMNQNEDKDISTLNSKITEHENIVELSVAKDDKININNTEITQKEDKVKRESGQSQQETPMKLNVNKPSDSQHTKNNLEIVEGKVDAIQLSEEREKINIAKMDIEKLETTEEMDIEKLETIEEMDTEKLGTTEEMDTEKLGITEEMDTEKLGITEEMDIEKLGTTAKMGTETLETTNEIGNEKLETTDGIGIEKLEMIEEQDIEKLEIMQRTDIDKVQTKEEMCIKELGNKEGMNIEKLKITEVVGSEMLETIEDINSDKLETIEVICPEKLEVTEGIGNEKLETIEGIGNEKLEISEGIGNKKLDTTEGISNEKLDTIEEMQQDSEKQVSSEVSSISQEQIVKTSEENSNTEDVADDTLNVENSNNLDPMLPETTIKAPSAVELEKVMELPVTEGSSEDKVETSISENTDTTSMIEIPMVVEVNEESVALPLEPKTTSDIAVPTDTITTESCSEIKDDSVKENSCKLEENKKVIDAESLTIIASVSEEQSQKLTEVQDTVEDTIAEKMNTEKTTNVVDVFQKHIESKDMNVSEEPEDTTLDFSEESKVDVQLVKGEEENSSPNTVLEEKEKMVCEITELKIPEDTCKEHKESLELIEHVHVKTLIETDVDVEKNEITPSVNNEGQVLDSNSISGELFLPSSRCTELIVPEENTKDTDTDDEMNLTLESEEAEMHSEMNQDNFEQKVEENNINKTFEVREEVDKEDEQISAIEMDDTSTTESLKIEKQGSPDTNAEKVMDSSHTEDSMQNRNEELEHREHIDGNDPKSDADRNNMKEMLETASNMEEMLSGEQGQNTQDIVTSILHDVRSATDFKNILTTETDSSNEIETVLQQSTSSPLVETELEELTEKLPGNSEDGVNKNIVDSISTQNIDSLEENTDLTEVCNDKPEDIEASNTLNINESTISHCMNRDNNIQNLQKEVEADSDLPENELDMDFEGAPLESVDDLEEADTKLELSSDMLLPNEDQSENLNNAQAIETSQPSSEISELESAVKFLQESEEQVIDSPLILSPKMVESVVDDISKQTDTPTLFVPDEDMCEDTELVEELQNIATDSISISEAEIISEAVKLESEKKLAEQIKLDASQEKFETNEEKLIIKGEEIKLSESEVGFDSVSLQNIEIQSASSSEKERIPETLHSLPLKTSEIIPKVSILEERLKEPPKIEIPPTDVTKVVISPTTFKDSLLIQKDAKLIAYQKMLESPKLTEKTEPKIMETPRKDPEKHDFENVGSPRIILKIAKSAITDCAEPRSPKSPKIRSATNSPNPEDSPGQKLGKIKLKLSKGGHPSIISNENVEEAGQWYSEGSLSVSPIGMKIKLSKCGDASIVSSEKHEPGDESKEGKHKFEEIKRTESPIGMKIKLLKTGDASIVQQDSKDMQIKHKDKLDIVQGSPKRTESPIGMKFKLSKSGDASIIPTERQDIPEEHREVQLRGKESSYDSPKRTDSPIGMKIKLLKTGDASIVSPDMAEDGREAKIKDKLESSPEIPKRTDSPIGMKIKLAKTKGGASIIPMENPEDTNQKLEVPDVPKRTESPLGMKIKLSKTGDASIVHSEIADESKDMKLKEKTENKDKQDILLDMVKLSDASGMRIKVIKSGETSTIAQEPLEEPDSQESLQKVESPIGMKIKLSKFGDPSIISTEKQEHTEETRPLPETPKRTESPIGMKIKLSRTGDASIIQSEMTEDVNKSSRAPDTEHSRAIDTALGMKIKLLKTGDTSIMDSEKKERQQRRRDTDSPLEMKIKLSKTGHPTIVACDNYGEPAYRPKEVADQHGFAQRYKEQTQTHKEPPLKFLKTGHPTILQSNRSELTIEPIQMQGKKMDSAIEISAKRKDITIAPIETKKSKLEAQLTQILPEVTIQPVVSRDQKQFMFDPKSSAISLQQMNVISQEISITQVRPLKQDSSMSDKLKDILGKNSTGSPMNSDCEIIEHRPELIIVNENSNSSQDVVIIEEVSPNRIPEVKIPKKRGRPRRNPLAQPIVHPPPHILISRDPLSLDETQQMQQQSHTESRENERPKRTCRSQKSYAPPKRGRGRGRGKRKLDNVDVQMVKKPRVEQDLTAIEASTTAVITIDGPVVQDESCSKASELYKALQQPSVDAKTVNLPNSTLPDSTNMQVETNQVAEVHLQSTNAVSNPVTNESKDSINDKKSAEEISEKIQKTVLKQTSDEKSDKTMENVKPETKDMLVPPEHQNWLTPTSKRATEAPGKNESVSTVQVIDEETRMSAESGSRSQTPARNISAPASETMVNEESQGSVLSTATTESEKVKVKNRRMEINFDPDEGPFTVDKIAEYEWPLDRKGETFMIQEQISQYLGVKSFKRKYPDLKRRVVDMEERNYLRENGLVSEAMCDMGLTAICSSEVLDVMCSDFPDQYEEYRKHMREKQVKEHSKKQKELSAAANAEKNRIDLAEMAVQSALSWNITLNKDRRENRKCSLDLQTFTIHVPKKQQKVETERKIGHYPVALIPGQYTDYYREYTPAELRYYPLNTVLYGPMRPNERKFDTQSEGSQSDSDSDSSSDDSSSSSSEGTQDTEGSQSTMDDVDMEIVNQKDEIKLKCKMCLKILNKHSKNEVLIQCGTCNGHVHPSCIDLTLDMVPHIQSYAWQCTDCKTCAQCHDPADEDKMLFCDMCDRGYHIYCVGLRRVPQGRWHCQECAVCANCGLREPGGANSDRNSVAQWQHEYKKGDKNTRVYVSTLCVPCSK